MIIISPLRVQQTKKKMFTLNLNQYRNAHFQVLNKSKVTYKALMKEQIQQLPEYKKIIIHYKLFPRTRMKTDIGNVVSVHKKYFEDSLVEFGKLPDDNYEYVVGSTESFG